MKGRMWRLERLRSVSRGYKLAVAKGEAARLTKRLASCGEMFRDLRIDLAVQREALDDARRAFSVQPQGWLPVSLTDGEER